MADPGRIAAEAERILGPRTLAGETLLVNAGGTREPIDAVRAITNRSSGKMGFAVAAEASRRGAEVVLVAAPADLPTPPGVRRIDVETALEMRDAVQVEFPAATIAILTAAVADFRPAHPAPSKIRKEELPPGRGLQLELVQNPDILAEICRCKEDRIVVGFAAESGEVVGAARRKLERKGCDLLVANDISREETGFEADANAVVFVWPSGEIEELPLLPKSEVAAHLLDRVEKLRGERR
jgi:phosphopantothenoylcysteine decarboxylase/phosphopantothenate--cysteine ligase